MCEMSKKNYGTGRAACITLMLALLFAGIAADLSAAPSSKLPDPIPRIAIVGDSWGMFTWWFRSIKTALQEAGFDHYVEMANESVMGGSKTFQFVNEEQYPPAADIRAAIMTMLTDNPTIDVVVISLGGNDGMRGTEYVLPEDPMKVVDLECPGAPDEHNQLLLEKTINQDMNNVIDYILAIRPDIRIVLPSYDFGGKYENGQAAQGCDLAMQQEGMMALDLYKQRLAATKKGRVFFCNNYGLMQYTFGTFNYDHEENGDVDLDSETPVYPVHYVKPGFDASDYPPLTLPEPDDIFTFPWTSGGNPCLVPGFPEYHSPMSSMLDHNIHLTDAGYDALAKRMVDRIIAPWLRNPKAFEILPLDTKGEQYQFQVTFSEPVSGVDVTDFEVTTATVSMEKIDITGAQVVSVTPTEGFNQVYTVTVDMNPGSKEGGVQDVVSIKVLDDDTIMDSDSNPLGGVNTVDWPNNGEFTYYGAFQFADLERPQPGDFASVQHYLGVISNPYLPMINYALSLEADKMDVNGDIGGLIASLMGSGEVDPDTLYVKGNGILESFEFGLIERCAKDATIDFTATGGVTHAIAEAAWNHNFGQMQYDLGGADNPPDHPNQALRILAGLDSMFAAYMTMGEPTLMAILSLASGYLTNESVSQFMPGIVFHQVVAANYTSLPQFFGARDKNGDNRITLNEYGDADGDGFNNAREYLYFQCEGIAAAIDAALDPAKTPAPFRTAFLIGEPLRLYVPELLHVNKTTYQWYKNDVPLVDGPGISGTQTRTLNIASLVQDDSGAYKCVYNENAPDAKGANVTYGPIAIGVYEELPDEGEGGEGEGEGEGGEEGEGEGEEEGPLDFCAIMDLIYETTQSEVMAPLLDLLGDDAALIGLILCDVADLNGPFVDTDTPPDGKPDMPGPNGLLDGAYELNVIAELINNPAFYTGLPSGGLMGQVAAGVDPAAAANAFEYNYNALYTPLEPFIPILPMIVQSVAGITLTEEQTNEILALFPNLLKILAGYCTLGDTDSLSVVLFLTNLLHDFVATIPTSPDAFITMNGILGPNGDADGDGFTNRQEYDVFSGVNPVEGEAEGAVEGEVKGRVKEDGEIVTGPGPYIKAALNPRISPAYPEGLLDFCYIMDSIYATTQLDMFAPLLDLLGDDAALISMILCETADLNGPFVDTDVPPDGDPDMPGPNGILDGAYELGLIAELANFPQNHLGLETGTLPGQVAAGVDASLVGPAFEANYLALYTPLEPFLPILPMIVQNMAGITLTEDQTERILALFPDLLSVLAGCATLGDTDSIGVVLFLTNLLKDFVSTIPTSADDFVTLNAILSAGSDADGDGFSNRAEYDFFAPFGYKAYIAAALDPGINPANPGEGEITEGEGAEGEGEGGEGEGEEGEGGEGEGEEGEGGEGEGEEGEGGGAADEFHTADQDGNGIINLSELLRVIQFFNSNGYHCDPQGEDGFAPGPGDQTCAHHASDYNQADWRINLSELLRLIQFFNSGGYHACPGQSTEDGYCPGLA